MKIELLLESDSDNCINLTFNTVEETIKFLENIKENINEKD